MVASMDTLDTSEGNISFRVGWQWTVSFRRLPRYIIGGTPSTRVPQAKVSRHFTVSPRDNLCVMRSVFRNKLTLASRLSAYIESALESAFG